MYISSPSLTSALVRVGGERHAPAVLAPVITWYSLYRRLGVPQGRSGRMRKISTPAGFDSQTDQQVAIPTELFRQEDIRSVKLMIYTPLRNVGQWNNIQN
jgi:hypothetical protein